ncbi:MAG: hypothetical protein ACAH80_15155 [Alphaproteobacteria bacterium]
MTGLTERQILALKTLEQFSMGKTAGFLNWADADSLVALGLASSFGKGRYVITEKGLAALPEEHRTPPPDSADA